MSEMQLSCKHWWKVESPQPGATDLYAFCRYCDAETFFPKDHEEARFNPKTHRPAETLRQKAIKGGEAKAAAAKAVQPSAADS